jgi:hypothetical protein
MLQGPIDHTFLMNCVIAFTSDTNKWPTPLFDMGYRLTWIDRSFGIGRLGSLKPDLLCTAYEESIVLLLECKGGKSIERRQLEKYLNISGENVQSSVSVGDRDAIVLRFAYAVKSRTSFLDELELVFPEIDEETRNSKNIEDIDVMEILPDSVRVWTIRPSNWSSNLVNGIQFGEGSLPQHFIPFSLDDSGDWILKLIARELIAIISKKSGRNQNPSVNARELVQSIFKVYDFLPEPEIQTLTQRVMTYFDRITKIPRFLRKIESIGRGTRISVKSLKEAIEELEKFGKEIEDFERTTPRLDELQ